MLPPYTPPLIPASFILLVMTIEEMCPKNPGPPVGKIYHPAEKEKSTF
jgi:hypothetical protein